MIPGFILAALMPFFIPFIFLLAIPAIIASIRYSQAFFILADHPEMGILDCIAQSKMIMTGNKMKYFLLILSFIGWMIIASTPIGFVTGIIIGRMSGLDMSILTDSEQVTQILYASYTGSPFFIFVMLISFVAFVFLYVYMMAAFTAFYEMASGNLRPGYIESTAEIVDSREEMTEERAEERTEGDS